MLHDSMKLELTRFRQSPQFWLNLQARYDLDRALAAMGRPALSAIQPVAA